MLKSGLTPVWLWEAFGTPTFSRGGPIALLIRKIGLPSLGGGPHVPPRLARAMSKMDYGERVSVPCKVNFGVRAVAAMQAGRGAREIRILMVPRGDNVLA